MCALLWTYIGNGITHTANINTHHEAVAKLGTGDYYEYWGGLPITHYKNGVK
jgi:hypothetical protein